MSDDAVESSHTEHDEIAAARDAEVGKQKAETEADQGDGDESPIQLEQPETDNLVSRQVPALGV